MAMDPLHSMRVMIVENDDLNATLLQLQLEREGVMTQHFLHRLGR